MTVTSESTVLTTAFIDELTREAQTTQRVLERVPEDKLTWRPHPKSMSLGQLALHIAQVPGMVAELINETPREAPKFVQPEANSKAEILSALDTQLAHAQSRLASWGDGGLMNEWNLKNRDRTLMTVPRIGMVRSIMLNHWYHHRGQLSVYLRLLDVPVPSIYGPSADENPFVSA
jgi:uncharacterized damage-inducible protein DinB